MKSIHIGTAIGGYIINVDKRVGLAPYEPSEARICSTIEDVTKLVAEELGNDENVPVADEQKQF